MINLFRGFSSHIPFRALSTTSLELCRRRCNGGGLSSVVARIHSQLPPLWTRTNSQVNKHNCRMWRLENPRVVIEHQRDSPKLNVWRGIMRDRIIGPYFFAEKTVTGNTCDRVKRKVINKNVSRRDYIPELQKKAAKYSSEEENHVLNQSVGQVLQVFLLSSRSVFKSLASGSYLPIEELLEYYFLTLLAVHVPLVTEHAPRRSLI
ncbi:hypothetical protein C0J52_09014 [Blattella germanica]|nr:hypothetical protein C0J52_09014 [Blattella germanica]